MSASMEAGTAGLPATDASVEPAAGAPGVWPSSARRIISDGDRAGGGALSLGGVDVRDLSAEFGTPLYVVDEDDFRSRCQEYRGAFADADVYYAGKAFLCTAVARWAAEEGLGLDVCTGGELAVALAAGFPPERIAFHGNNKSTEELSRALDVGVGRIVLDSFQEIARLGFLAEQRGSVATVLLRVTTGVEADTHEYIATAHDDQKFGLPLRSGVAADAARHVLALGSLELAGLHSHIGSQLLDTAGFERAARRIVGLLAEVRDEHGIELRELNLGGGLGIPYVPGDEAPDVKVVADNLRGTVGEACAAAGLSVPRLAVEPGRAIAGPAGVTLYEVGTIKDPAGPGYPGDGEAGTGAGAAARVAGPGAARRYVSVDGGMSDNIRTALYGADYTCVLASRGSTAAHVRCRLVGKHCESGDVIAFELGLPADLAPGDLLAVAATGAYCRALANNYNHVPRPGVVAVRGGNARPIVRRETEQDLLRLDPGAGAG